MSVNSSMTAIADKIRALLGLSGAMGLDAMATNLGTEQTNIANAFSAIGNKGGTVPSSKVSGNLASAINSIPSGVTVQRTSGSFTTDTSGAATVNCGFKPDLVLVTGLTSNASGSNAEYQLAMAFEETTSNYQKAMMASTNNYFVLTSFITQTSSGFSISAMTSFDYSLKSTTISRQTFNYVAIKYTE